MAMFGSLVAVHLFETGGPFFVNQLLGIICWITLIGGFPAFPWTFIHDPDRLYKAA